MSARAQEVRLPLHLAVENEAGLQVVQALLQAHPDGAKVADKVRGGECGVHWFVYVGGGGIERT